MAAARTAGAVQKKHYGKLLNVDCKMRNDIKLEVDRLCEDAIINSILQVFPTHGILSEERGLTGGEASEYLWIIDPLDGTVNFFYGLPYFCTSIACYRLGAAATGGLPGEAVCAAVYAPLTGDLFTAEAGAGAELNGEELRVAHIDRLAEAMIATGFGSTEAGIRKLCDGGATLAGKVRKLRCLGAAAYDICNVACGRLSGFFEKGLYNWDVAAAALIATEAGAKVRMHEISPGRWDFLACAPGIFDELSALLDQSDTQSHS